MSIDVANIYGFFKDMLTSVHIYCIIMKEVNLDNKTQ